MQNMFQEYSIAAPLHEIVRHEIVRHEIVRHGSSDTSSGSETGASS